MEWIVVKNEPIPKGEMVIITDGHDTYVGELNPFNGWDFQISNGFNPVENCFDLNAIMLKDITHWMPLPKLPQYAGE